MELTNKDKKHIQEEVRKVEVRVKMEATEYAKLCERYYYQCLMDKLAQHIEVVDYVQENSEKWYNNKNLN